MYFSYVEHKTFSIHFTKHGLFCFSRFFSLLRTLSLFHSSALTLQISLCFWKFHFQYLNLIVCWRICFVLYMYGVCSSNRYYGIYVCYVGWFYSTTASFNVICVPYGFKSAQAAQSHWINMCVFSWLTSNYHIEFNLKHWRESIVQYHDAMANMIYQAVIYCIHFRASSSRERLERKLPRQLCMYVCSVQPNSNSVLCSYKFQS